MNVRKEWKYSLFYSSMITSQFFCFICWEDNVLKLHINKDIYSESPHYLKPKMKDGWTDKDEWHHSHVPFSPQARQRKTTYPRLSETIWDGLRQMKHHKMSLEYPVSLQWVSYTSPHITGRILYIQPGHLVTSERKKRKRPQKEKRKQAQNDNPALTTMSMRH